MREILDNFEKPLQNLTNFDTLIMLHFVDNFSYPPNYSQLVDNLKIFFTSC